MPKYEVRLESQTDSQARIVSVDAQDPQAARSVAEAGELALVNFSLLPPERDVWECPPGGPESPDGLVDLSRWDAYDRPFYKATSVLNYRDACSAAARRVADLENRIDVAPTGKVRGSALKGRAQARVLAHRQTEPYAVADVREVPAIEVDAQRLVRELASLKGTANWDRTLDALREAGIPLAVVTAGLYGLIWQDQIEGSASRAVWATSAINVSLHNAYTFEGANQDAHDFFSDASASQVTGTGYSAGGVALGTKTSTYDTASDQIRLDAADTSWAASTISATDAIVTNTTPGSDATNPLLGAIDFGATVATTAGTFQITWDATGIVNFDLT